VLILNHAFVRFEADVSTFVDDVLQLSAAAVFRGFSHEIDGLLAHLLLLGAEVQLQDALTFGLAGQARADLQVEASRSKQCLVNHVLAVGSSNHEDVAVLVEAVHLGKELVDGRVLLAFSRVYAHRPAAYRVDLVDEDDAAFCTTAGLSEQLTDSLRTDTNVDLLELRC